VSNLYFSECYLLLE